MKEKIIFGTVLFALMLFSVKAQETVAITKNKGSFLVNGTALVNYNTKNINDNKSNEFALGVNPKMGYFLADNLAIGAELGVRFSSSTQDDGLGEIKTTSTLFSLMPFARYYIVDGFFGELAIGGGTQNAKIEGPAETELKGMSYGARIGAGYSFALSNSVAIEPIINYSWEKFNPKDAPDDYKETLSIIFAGVGLTAFF